MCGRDDAFGSVLADADADASAGCAYIRLMRNCMYMLYAQNAIKFKDPREHVHYNHSYLGQFSYFFDTFIFT